LTYQTLQEVKKFESDTSGGFNQSFLVPSILEGSISEYLGRIAIDSFLIVFIGRIKDVSELLILAIDRAHSALEVTPGVTICKIPGFVTLSRIPNIAWTTFWVQVGWPN
jgi:hypothetical protein